VKLPHIPRRAVVAGAAVAAIAGGGAAAALATGGSSGNTYQGCLQHELGALYNIKVNPSSPPRCFSRDTTITWNQTGPPGAPGATGPAGVANKQTNTFGPVDVTIGSAATLVESCTSSAHPTLIGGGYSLSPAAITNVTATVDGPSGENNWEVVIVNNSGQTVSFTEFTVCT
jgi:hypothetical protein